MIGDSSAAAVGVVVVAENGAAAAADAAHLAAEQDPRQRVAEVLRQEDEEQRIHVQRGEDEAVRDDLDGDEGFGAGMRGHILDEEEHLDRQPDHVEDEEDDDLSSRVSLFTAELLLRRFRARRQAEEQMANDEAIQDDDEHQGTGKGTETTVDDLVLTGIDKSVNVCTRGAFNAVRCVVTAKEKGERTGSFLVDYRRKRSFRPLISTSTCTNRRKNF